VQPNSVSHKLCVFSLLLLALWQSGSCRSVKMATMSQEQHPVAAGIWGGQNAQLDVTEDGARIRFSCARGSIEQPVKLDAEGRFSVEGTFTAEAMGPQREDNPPKSRPAVYTGSVKDQEMTLTVTLKETKEEAGKFTLTHGKAGRVWKCH